MYERPKSNKRNGLLELQIFEAIEICVGVIFFSQNIAGINCIRQKRVKIFFFFKNFKTNRKDCHFQFMDSL